MNGNSLSIYRNEIKYLISNEIANGIQNRIGIILKKDINSNAKGYIVRSLYFDTINDLDFNSKMSGIEIRKKIRIRVYDFKSKNCKLEMKQKFGELQHKISLWITKEDALELIKMHYFILKKYFDNPVAISIYTTMIQGCYRPVVMVEYDRIAYTSPINNTRITFDMNIRSSESNFDLFSDNIQFSYVMMNQVVLETKYNIKLLNTIQNILACFHLTKVSTSKYCISRNIFQNFNY